MSVAGGKAQALELIRQGRRFLLCGHRRPDADALGSALGLAAILRRMGKEAIVYAPDPLSASTAFILGAGDCWTEIASGERFDATFSMDTASPQLLPDGLPPRSCRGPLVVLDHHSAHERFGDVIIRDIGACATAQVVLDLAAELGEDQDLPIDAAAPLYAALVADTGGFRYAGTSPETLRLGARLLESGVDPWQTAYHLFEGWPIERMRLLSAVLETLEVHAEGRIALLQVTQEMLSRLGATAEMVEGLVTYGRMLRGAQIAVLLWEWPTEIDAAGFQQHFTKLSLRSSGVADVAALATIFGGGGHHAAAGANLEMPLSRAREAVLSVLLERLDP
ncbi:MAG: DHH family phosphoesterase [Myxococcales bacterium]|nr:DHH family phosphoesterase [Myxococcales bacterium]